METFDDLYNSFLKALRHVLEKEGHGGRAYLAAKAGVSSSMISLMLSRPDRTKASMKKQVALAEACGYEHADFIALGRKLLSGEEEPSSVRINCVYEEPQAYQLNDAPATGIDTITLEHMELVKKFKYKELAKNINEDLLKIDDQEILKEVEVLIRAISLGMGFEVKLTGKSSKPTHQSRPVGKLKNGTED